MNDHHDLERRLADFYDAEAPRQAPDRVLHAALASIDTTRQRRVLIRAPRRFQRMNTFARLAIAAAAVIVVGVGLAGAGPFRSSGTGPGSVATPSPSAAVPSSAGASPSAAALLTGRPWGLSAVTGKTPDFQGVVQEFQQPDYWITFNTDGTYSGTAVCNPIAGTYSTRGNALTITAGASTLVAFCPSRLHGDGDIATIFAHSLTKADLYTVTDTLTITLNDGGTMTFNPLQAAPTSAGSSALASLPPEASPPTELVGKTWKLKSIADRKLGFQGVVPEADRSKYTIKFSADGTFNATVDCNQLGGTYTAPRMPGADLPAGGITMLSGPSALAVCPPGSLADLFLTGLGSTSSYVIDGNQLTIALGDASPLQFTP